MKGATVDPAAVAVEVERTGEAPKSKLGTFSGTTAAGAAGGGGAATVLACRGAGEECRVALVDSAVMEDR